MRVAKEVEYWGLVAIIGPRPDKIRVILRRVGTGNITYWSVMRGAKILPDGRGLRRRIWKPIENRSKSRPKAAL